MSGPIGRLHVITDSLRVARAALAAGAPVIQVRAKGLADLELLALASEVVEAAARTSATVVVNDRCDIAVAVGAHGAHVGADDLPVDSARRVLGPGAILGGTARDPETARRHEAAGATYLGVGPTYPTATKSGLPAPLGPAGVKEIAQSVAVPVIAIAGVTPARVPELLEAGVHGVAVVGAVADADDPGAATTELLRALERAGARP